MIQDFTGRSLHIHDVYSEYFTSAPFFDSGAAISLVKKTHYVLTFKSETIIVTKFSTLGFEERDNMMVFILFYFLSGKD